MTELGLRKRVELEKTGESGCRRRYTFASVCTCLTHCVCRAARAHDPARLRFPWSAGSLFALAVMWAVLLPKALSCSSNKPDVLLLTELFRPLAGTRRRSLLSRKVVLINEEATGDVLLDETIRCEPASRLQEASSQSLVAAHFSFPAVCLCPEQVRTYPPRCWLL